MVNAHRGMAWLGALAVVLAACAPAQEATPTPTRPPPTPMSTPATPPTPVPVGVTPPPAIPTPTPAKPPVVKAKAGGYLRMVNDYRDPIAWDRWARKDGGRDVSTRTYMVFSQLVAPVARPDNPCTLEVVPDLADSWRWLDDRTLEIKLRQGVKFHNKPPVSARELTSADVVWSATQFMKENTIRGMERTATLVTKIEAPDRYTVRFTLASPLPSFLTEGLTSEYGAQILPPEVADKEGRWPDPAKSYIGTGPFMFKEYRPAVRTSFVKNPEYFKKGLPYLDAIDFMGIPDMSTQVAALRSGTLDLVYSVPAALALPLKGIRGIEVLSCPQSAATPGRFYFRTDLRPFNDVRVRRAVQMSIDRQGLVDAVLLGQGVTTPHYPALLWPGYLRWEELPPEVAQWVKYDPKRARELLAEAGYPKGFDAGMMVNSAYTTPYPQMAEAIVGFLRDIGINTKANYLTSVEFIARIGAGDFADNLMIFGYVSALTTPTVNLDGWRGKGPVSQNRSRINDPELDKVIDQFLVEADPKKSQELFKRLELRLIDQAWEPTAGAFTMQFTGMRNYVKDFAGPHQYYSGTYLEALWLDK